MYRHQPLGRKGKKTNSANIILESKYSYLIRLIFMVKVLSSQTEKEAMNIVFKDFCERPQFKRTTHLFNTMHG